ncbi:MAG: DUF4286 family protein [Lysobacterales bacterium]|nr:MAG: DUF4286 family protein [Xanthomonadales bacterium]
MPSGPFAFATLAAVQPPSESRSVLYEVNFEADAAISGPFDTWLRDHVADVLQSDGFRSAEILDDDSAPPGRIRRIVQYRLHDRTALERYLATVAPRLEEAGRVRFGERYSATPRVLPHREEFVLGAFSTENCLNCGEVLRGQHCSHCGQHAQVRVLSMWGLVKDVVGDLLNADSRVWRTLWPLGFRPGLLTQDYLRGRRARYTPPFRMYLVLSVVFFVLASLEDPGRALEFNVDENAANIQLRDDAAAADGAGKPVVVDTKPGPGGPMYKARPLDEDARKLIEGIVARVPASEREAIRAQLEREMSQASPEDRAVARRFMADPCGEENLRVDVGAEFEPLEERLRGACRKIVADQQGFGRAIFDNVPKMMFIFLPLIAGVLALLYLRSGRYYVEHLLFVVHFHAFFFLAGIVALLLDHLAALLSGGAARLVESVQGFYGAACVFYVPWYLLMALRRVYGQSWWKTVPKFGILGIAYFVSLVLTAIGLLAYTALTL